jgi:hypothetical protein
MSINSIKEQVEKLQIQYQTLFGGQPRISRDASILDVWIGQLNQHQKELQATEEDVDNLKPDLIKLILDRKELYQSEATEIRKLQKLSPIAIASYVFGEWLDLSFQRYQRNFAGKSRSTRDLNLLSELSAELRILSFELQELLKQKANPAKQDLENFQKRIEDHLKMYDNERKEILKAQKADGDINQQAGILANLANQCFAAYRTHFQGKPRTSRRLTTLERICTQLSKVKQEMKAIPFSKLTEDMRGVHLNNQKIVESNLEGYEAEKPMVENAQNALNLEGWVSHLATAADQTFKSYQTQFAGKSRSACNPDVLSDICDELFDILTQLKPLLAVVNQDTPPEVALTLKQTIRVSMDQLRLFHREWEEVTKAVKAINTPVMQ